MSLLTLANAKEYIGISHVQKDTVLQIMLDMAEAWVEKAVETIFHSGSIAQTTEYVNGGQRNLWPSYKPILSLVSVTERTSGDELDLDYIRWTTNRIFKDDETFFATGSDEFEIVYTAGYNASSLPAGLKLVILDLTYRAYWNLGGKKSDSGAGSDIDWEKIADSDIMQKLEPFIFRKGFF